MKEYRVALELPREEIGRCVMSEKPEDHAVDISIWPILKSRKNQKGEHHGTIRTFRTGRPPHGARPVFYTYK